MVYSTRQIKDLDFQLILPGVSGTVILPPREKPEEASAATETNFLPQQSLPKIPQATLPLSKSAPSLTAIILQKRKPGRPPKSRLAPTASQAGLSSCIPTQSDGEGIITKKRKVGSETSDRTKNRSGKITITKSTKPTESPFRVDQDHVSQYNDTCPVSPANVASNQKMNELARRVLEKETGLRTSDDAEDGVNKLMSKSKETDSAKPVSRILNGPLESETIPRVTISGQVSETKEDSRPSKLGLEEEGVDIPSVDINLKKRPTRRKRIFVGEMQRFADENAEVPRSGNSAAAMESENGKAGKKKATLKTAKPRGRPKKVSPGIKQGSLLEEDLRGKNLIKTKSGMQKSQLQGCLEEKPRRRGRPKKIAIIDCKADDPERVIHGERGSQIRNSQTSPSMETEQQPIHSITGKDMEPTLQDVSQSPRLDGNLYPLTVKSRGNPPLGTQEQPRKASYSLGEVSHPSSKSDNGGLDKSETGMNPPRNSQFKPRGRLPKKSRLRGEASDPLGASYSSRIQASELDMQVIDPCEKLSSGTEGHLSKVSTIQGQTSYSPGIFYSALAGASKHDTKTVNSLKNAPSTLQEQAQRKSPPRNVTNLNETAPKKRLALLQRQHTKDSSKKNGDRDRSFAPVLKKLGKEEEVSRSSEVYNDELTTKPPRITDPSTIQSGQNKVHPERQLQELAKSKPNDAKPAPREGGDPQTKAPSKKRGRRKKETIPHAELSKTKKTKEGSIAECRVALSKRSSNLVPISVHRLSCDSGESITAATDSVVYINDKCMTAADVMSQICQEFALESHAQAKYLVQSRSRTALKSELKRKLEINEDGRGTLDRSLFQLVCI